VTPEEQQLDLDIEPEEPEGGAHEPPVEEIGEDLNVPLIAAVGIVSTITVLALIMLLVGLFYSTERNVEESKYSATGETSYDELRKEQVTKLGSYGWVDVDAGVVSVPIDRAMQLTAVELARDQAVFVMEQGRNQEAAGAAGTGGDEEGEKR
jgi:hypothetical protein